MIDIPLALARLSDLKGFAADGRIVAPNGWSAYHPDEIQALADLITDLAFRLAQK